MNGYINKGHLSNIIAYCITKAKILILSIHDDNFITCKSGNWAYFNTKVMNFWTSPAVVNLINTNKSIIIINLANEFDKVRWTNDTIVALNIFKTNYNTAITTLRNAGITVPIMIDAPDCGQSSSKLLSIALNMNNSDSQNNLIFSSHTYWEKYASTLTQIQAKLNEAKNTNGDYVLAEIANNQYNNRYRDLRLYNIYPTILQESCSRNIGCLTWFFNNDYKVYNPSLKSTNFLINTTNSSSNNLIIFGNDIVNNDNYGLKSTQGCGATVFFSEQFNLDLANIVVYPNPSLGKFSVSSTYKITKVTCVDMTGKQIDLQTFDTNSYQINAISNDTLY